MLDAGVAMEVSTAGLRKPVGEIYPARPMLEMAVDAGMPIALSRDAHVPEHLAYGYEEAVELLQRLRREGDRRVRAPRAPDGAARVRFGLGIDTHRFAEGRPLILGGVEIPHDRGLAGTRTPTCSPTRSPTRCWARRRMGDIGQHFPDTDPALEGRGLDRRCCARPSRRVAAEGWRVEFVDATVMLERPKLAPHREAIMARAERGRRRAGAREGDDRRGDGLRRPRGGRRGAGRRDAGPCLSSTSRCCTWPARSSTPARGRERRRGRGRVRRRARLGIEWLQTYDSLPERGQQSEPVQACSPAARGRRRRVRLGDSIRPTRTGSRRRAQSAAVEHWIDGAAERFGEFELGDYAFVAELRLDDEVELGWAYQRVADAARRSCSGARRTTRARMEWTAATVEGLAPDPRRSIAARKLARPAPWSETGRDERAVWGLCKGSGQAPYQVAVDPTGPAYKCSCPSRKVPCKHALALLLLRRRRRGARGRAAGVGRGAARRARAGQRAPGEPPRDPEAAARRAAEREERVAAGVEDLRLWLRDAVRGGLGAGRLRDWEEWDAFAARMVDAQAPGRGLAAAVARERRRRRARTAGRSGCCPAWGCCTCCARRTRAPTGRCATTCARCSAGTSRARTCSAGRTCATAGSVLARVVLEQERLRVRARGCGASDSERAALLLDFAPPGAPLAPRPPAGSAVDAELAFYPGATPLRALVAGETAASTTRRARSAPAALQAALASAAAALAANPWLDEWPVALAAAVPDGPATWTLSRRGRLAPAARAERPLASARALRRASGVRLRAVERRRADAARGRRRQPDGGAVSWEELVAAALIGTDRRPVVAAAPPGAPDALDAALAERGAEDRLLASAAAWTVARRAGARVGEPVAVDARRATIRGRCARPPPARGCGRCSRTRSAELVDEWLELAAARGVRPPPELAARPARSCVAGRHARGSSVSWPGRSGCGWPSASRAGRSCAAPSTTWTPCGRAAAARTGGRCSSGSAAPIRPRPASCWRARSPRRPGRTARRSSTRSRSACPTPTSRSWRRRSTTRAQRFAMRPRRSWPRSRARGSPRGWRSARSRCSSSRAARSSSRCPGRRTRRRSATGSARAGARSASTALLAATPLATWPLELGDAAGGRQPRACRPRRLGRGRATPAQRRRGRARCGGSTTELLAVLPRAEAEAHAAAAADPFAAALRLPGSWGPELSREGARGHPGALASPNVRVAAYHLDPALAPEAEPLRDLGRPRRRTSSATCSPSGLPCCGSCRDRRDATPPAPRRAALRRRVAGPGAHRRPAEAAALAPLAVGGGDLRARRRRARSRRSTSAAAGSSSSPWPRSPPTARCCCSACPGPRRRGCPSTSRRPSAATAR